MSSMTPNPWLSWTGTTLNTASPATPAEATGKHWQPIESPVHLKLAESHSRFLHVMEQGAVLRRAGTQVQITKKDALLAEIPAIKLQGVVVYGNIQVTTHCLRNLLAEGVWLSFFTRHGAYKGRLQPPAVARADKPNFSGRWEVDKAKSTFRFPKGVEPPAFDNLTVLIDHQEPKLKLTFIERKAQTETTITYNLTTDGAENRNVLGQGYDVRSRARWDGTRLIGESKHTIAKSGKPPITVTGTATWILSEDGKTLTSEESQRFRKRDMWSRLKR
jgi:hypothetical protein